MSTWRPIALAGWLSFFFIGSLAADNTPAQKDTKRYLEELQLKLDHLAQRANQPKSQGSNVIGLRGSKQEPLSKQLYWKGKETPAPVRPEEVKAFRSAVEQARMGKNTEAAVSLKQFETAYPKSALLPDVKETLRMLEIPGAAPTPESKPPTAQ